jgi:hypothetical protein
MTPVAVNSRLWSLVDGARWIDPSDLLRAIKLELSNGPCDFRTRLLVRDSYRALESHWGHSKLSLSVADVGVKLGPILEEDLGEAGFPTLGQRMMERVKPETIFGFFQELGRTIQKSTQLEIGYLAYPTNNVDVVDQAQNDLLSELAIQFGLSLTHFQSHNLPAGWLQRVRSFGRFDLLDVYLIDVHDIFLGKLFSSCEKDFDDLRVLKRALDKNQIIDRVKTSGRDLAAEPLLRAVAERNWYVLFGEPLPT